MNSRKCLRLTISFCLLFTASIRVILADDTNQEARLVAVLQSASSPREKDAACVWLKRHGSVQSVPALAALLSDEQLSHSARYALESMPGPEAEKALITGLAQTSVLLKAGVINSLGVRRDALAVPELAKLLADADDQIANASAASLGDIAVPGALKALEDRLNDSDTSRQGALIDGCLRCAQHLLAAGDHKQAFAVYQKIYQRRTKEFFHVAAFRGLVLSSGSRGVDLIANAISSGPVSLEMEAVQLVHEKGISGLTEPIAGLLPRSNPLLQVALIDALSQRDDPAATPEIEALAEQGGPDARVAAVSSLGTLGDDKTIPLLINIAVATGDPAQAAAREALALVNRGNPNKALLELLSGSKPETQIEIIRALSSRTAVEAVPRLLQLARQADDSVRDAAFQALDKLIDQPQLAVLVRIVGQMTTDASRASAARAVVAACQHIQRRHGTVDMSSVWETLKTGSAEMRAALLPVCGSFTEPEARVILRDGIADSDSKIHAAAVRALCDTTDPALLPDVVRLVTDPSEKEFRAIAIESCVRLTTMEESISIPEQERMKLFEAITPAASGVAEKRVVLSGLGKMCDERALPLAESFLSDPAVSSEASQAVIGICVKLDDAEAAGTLLKRFISQITSDPMRKEAEAALKMVQARADYITTWEFAGPYRQTGQNFSRLFDIVFPPETGGSQGTTWRHLPLSEDPGNPWVMDLLKAMGGEQEVAYARASIHSAVAQPAGLSINSDDGVKVWLNGELIHANNVSRSWDGPADEVNIKLKAGWNDLLLKVTQNNSGWGFFVRLTKPDGSRPKGVYYVADPVDTPK